MGLNQLYRTPPLTLSVCVKYPRAHHFLYIYLSLSRTHSLCPSLSLCHSLFISLSLSFSLHLFHIIPRSFISYLSLSFLSLCLSSSK